MPVPTPTDLENITALVEATQAHQSDVQQFMTLHTDSALIVNIVGRRLFGAPAIRDAMTQALASPLAHVLTTIEVDDIRLVTPDVAIVSCTKHVTDERDDADTDALPLTGRLTYVAVREHDRWRIASNQTTPVVAS
jgi:uncharacterized protein (TIGR02246 family)